MLRLYMQRMKYTMSLPSRSTSRSRPAFGSLDPVSAGAPWAVSGPQTTYSRLRKGHLGVDLGGQRGLSVDPTSCFLALWLSADA